MTRYTVVWEPELESDYLRSWIASNQETRAILTEVANRLDLELAHDPTSQGRAMPEIPYRYVEITLTSTMAYVAAVYEVLPDDRIVRVERLVFRRG